MDVERPHPEGMCEWGITHCLLSVLACSASNYYGFWSPNSGFGVVVASTFSLLVFVGQCFHSCPALSGSGYCFSPTKHAGASA